MKRIALFIALLLVASCGGKKTDRSYKIDGKFSAEDGATVYLIDLEKNDTLGVSNVTGGAFSFEGSIDSPTYVYVGRGRERVRFIMEQGNVSVDLDERTVEGTPMVDEYVAYNHRFYGFDSFSEEGRKAQADLADSMILAHKNDLMGALVMEDLAFKDPERFLIRYEEVSDEVRSFSVVDRAYRNIKLVESTSPGMMFTDYTVAGGNPDGTDVSLSDYVGKGRFILLDHWASWCGPCKAEIPHIRKVWDAFHGDKFEVVSIAVSDAREDTEKALATLDMPWPQIFDGGKIPQEIYGVSAIPHLILFAPDGTIAARGMRGEEIYETIARFIK